MNKITKLIEELENELSFKMEEFSLLGKQSKEMLNNGEDREAVNEVYLEMAEILHDIEPMEYVVRKNHPELCSLFDNLIKLRKDNLSQ